jgi:hypothetical protein
MRRRVAYGPIASPAAIIDPHARGEPQPLVKAPMRATSSLVARFNRLERLARTANDLPKNSSSDAGATVAEPVMPLVQSEVVTDESGHQFVLGLANVRGQWVAARYEIVWPGVISDVVRGPRSADRRCRVDKGGRRAEAVLGGL